MDNFECGLPRSKYGFINVKMDYFFLKILILIYNLAELNNLYQIRWISIQHNNINFIKYRLVLVNKDLYV